jgi:hypothetical protein
MSYLISSIYERLKSFRLISPRGKGMDGFPLTRMCGRDRIKRFRRIRKSKKIRIQPSCGEYPSWIS